MALLVDAYRKVLQWYLTFEENCPLKLARRFGLNYVIVDLL